MHTWENEEAVKEVRIQRTVFTAGMKFNSLAKKPSQPHVQSYYIILVSNLGENVSAVSAFGRKRKPVTSLSCSCININIKGLIIITGKYDTVRSLGLADQISFTRGGGIYVTNSLN